MTISLSDLISATSTYIDLQVEVEVIKVTRNVEAGKEGNYTVRVTNAAAPDGVRLNDVTLHITVDPVAKALLKPTGQSIVLSRATADVNDPLLPTGVPVPEMWVFFQSWDGEPNNTLDIGEQMEVEFEYVAVAAGNAIISCHMHATVDVNSVFPRSRGKDGEGEAKIVAA